MVVKNFNNQNIYLFGSFKHFIPGMENFSLIIPQVEVRNVNSKIRDYKILSRTISGGVTYDTIDNSQNISEFKHFLGFGAGTEFKTTLVNVKVDILFGWNLKKGMDNIFRFNLKTKGGYNIGGEVRNALSTEGRNEDQQFEILTYISKDIDIDFFNNVLGLKK
jgi:hypothetical protein